MKLSTLNPLCCRPATHAATCFGVVAILITNANAHEVSAHCSAIKESVSNAGFSDRVTVTCANGQALISSDTYPDHELMTGIVGTNEQLPVPADYAAPVPLQPSVGAQPVTRDAALGVAVNGVPIYDYTGGGEMSVEDRYHHQTRHASDSTAW